MVFKMKCKMGITFLLVYVCLGCSEVKEFLAEEETESKGGIALIESTYPAVGAEVENGTTLTITFNDGSQIENKQITVNGSLVVVVGNQATWKMQDLKSDEENSFLVMWNNTDGSIGSHILVFHLYSFP